MRTRRLAHVFSAMPARGWLPFPDGEGTTGGDGGGGTAGATGSSGDAGATGATGATGTDGATGTGTGSVTDFPEAAQKLIRELRDEAAKHRTGKTAAEKAAADQLAAIAKALGIAKDGQLTAEQLAEKLTAADGKAKSALTELAVHRAASKHGADPEALLDSRGFLAKLGDIDPTANDFAGQVEAAIKDAVKENPKLKAQAAGAGAGKSGGEFNGGSGDQGAITEAQLKTMNPGEIAKALDEGRLKHLL